VDNDKFSQQSEDVRAGVRKHYGKMAAEFEPEPGAGCCPGESGVNADVPLTSLIYQTEGIEALPVDVTGLSAGCGDPITLASLQPGETVLDLGSGGGIDCFMAAKQVGDKGHVIGVDMTAEMIEKARANKSKLKMENVEFRLGEIEHLPVADGTVDVIISNCVINLSPDKAQVIREAYRVLKQGGRLAVSDIVTDGPLPREIQENMAAWYGCLAGAMDYRDFQTLLEAAGFINVDIRPAVMQRSDLEGTLMETTCQCEGQVEGTTDRKAYFMVEGKLKPLDLKGANPPFNARITAYKSLDKSDPTPGDHL
jgi:arsenite methyltransferase